MKESSKKPASKKVRILKPSGEEGHKNYFALRLSDVHIEDLNWFVEETGLNATDAVRGGTIILLNALREEKQWAIDWVKRLRSERGLR
jgi:hypothetical protein